MWMTSLPSLEVTLRACTGQIIKGLDLLRRQRAVERRQVIKAHPRHLRPLTPRLPKSSASMR